MVAGNPISSMEANHKQINTIGADVLRGVAILMVIVYHACGQTYGFQLPWSGLTRDFSTSGAYSGLVYSFSFGWAGVSLFFVISGFCIHYSYLRSPHFEISHFFWRRFWRIYPAYFAALLGFTILAYVASPSQPLTKQFLWHALFIHNLSESTFFGINASFWSIATEMQIYLLFPVLIFLRKRFGIERALLVTFLVGCVWRVVMIAMVGLPEHAISAAFTAPFMTWFDWTLGAVVAERFVRGDSAFRQRGKWLLVLVSIFIGSTLFKPATVFSFSLAAGISAVALDAALARRWKQTPMVVTLTFIGTISYSLYLWHQPIMTKVPHSIARLLGHPGAWAAFLVCLIIGAYGSYRLLELGGVKFGASCWSFLFQSRKAARRTIPQPAEPKP